MPDGELPRVLVVEDGEEYISNLARFLGHRFRFTRAGSAPEALELLPGDFAVVFLDMRFDRVPAEALLGDLRAVADRYAGDLARAREYLERNQGVLLLAELRARGIRTPALLSYDFGAEPRRWANLRRLYAPVDYLPDNAGPEAVGRALSALLRGPA